MLIRFKRSPDFMPMSDFDLVASWLHENKSETIEQFLSNLNKMDSVTKELQNDAGVILSDISDLFHALVPQFLAMVDYNSNFN